MTELGGFISGRYLDDLYQRYLREPRSVSEDWRALFGAFAVSDADAYPGPVRLDPLGRDGGAITPGAYIRNPAGTMIVETGHIDNSRMKTWLAHAMAQPWTLDGKAQLALARRLIEAEEFERFLSVKLPTKKRFSVEGAEVYIALLAHILEQASSLGINEAVVASMHRGRLNTMANVFGKDLEELFAQLKGAHPFGDDDPRPADMTYHNGIESRARFGNRSMRVLVCPNPSHLEAVNCVALGRLRAIQEESSPTTPLALGLLLHTDASVAAQGSVFEMIQLGGTRAFSVGGALHVIVNNQIGFTTDPCDARTSLYCTGAWKSVDSAIFHVNADAPEAVLHAGELALAFRQTFACDAVIDLICYRRHGHNELDEPRFTQPALYRAIADHVSAPRQYIHALAEAQLDVSELGVARSTYIERLHSAYDAAATRHGKVSVGPAVHEIEASVTGIEMERLQGLLDDLGRVPAGFAGNAKIRRVLNKALERDEIDWALAESLSIAALLQDGVDVFLSGQDVARGSFSQRHFALHDVNTSQSFSRFDAITGAQARFEFANSPLSEHAVLGFAYGYSVARPRALTIWEAQFGDFANGAQIIIDQFIVSGAEKWNEHGGLVVLLPHGLEGQGPEHSSARIERFLQMAAGGNIRVANPSTPSNYFHLLRQQALRVTKVPLFVIAPKTLLRLPAAVSAKKAFGKENRFQGLSHNGPVREIHRVLLCSGKIAYALEAAALTHGHTTLIVRLEQLYPTPLAELSALLCGTGNVDWIWVQEEPENMGAWPYLERRLNTLRREMEAMSSPVRYCGRPEAASPAGSFHAHHQRDQAAIIAAAFAGIE